MNKKLKGLALAAGVLAGAGSLIPLTTYAIDASPSPTVSVTVPATLTINGTRSASVTNATATAVGTGTLGVTVTTNKKYSISLSAAITSLKHSDSSIADTIPAIASGGTSTLTAGTNKWGIKKAAAAAGQYTGLTTTSVPFYESNSGATGVETSFTVGVSIAATLTAGSYSTTVTATVANT